MPPASFHNVSLTHFCRASIAAAEFNSRIAELRLSYASRASADRYSGKQRE
jgi:hypothetical protein